MSERPGGHSVRGKVHVSIGEDGLVDSVDIDPYAMRAGSGALAELVRDAVREAQEGRLRRLADVATSDDEADARGRRLQSAFDEIDVVYMRRMQELHSLLDRLSR